MLKLFKTAIPKRIIPTYGKLRICGILSFVGFYFWSYVNLYLCFYIYFLFKIKDVDNAIGEVIEKDVKFRLEKFYDEMNEEYFEVQMIKRIQGTFFEKLELYNFPFDVSNFF